MEPQVTDFLVEKWRQGFLFYDRNKDGVVTGEDLVELADRISEKTGASEDEAARTRQEWVKWLRIIQPDPSKHLDMDAFINNGRELFKDQNNLIKLNRATASDFFDRIDLNGDGKITMDELTIFYEAVGYNDKALVENIFKHLDKNGDGFIDREELVEDYVRYFTHPDPVEGQAYIIPMKM